MRDLRLKLSAVEKPWYLITKDGEWAAVSRKRNLLQSKTGNRQLADFKIGNRFRRLENTDLAIAMMAFLGFVDDARTSRVFKSHVFDHLFGSKPTKAAWARLATGRLQWNGSEFHESFESGVAPATTWVLAHMIWNFWKTRTFPESQQFLLACEEAGRKDPRFKSAHLKSSGWDINDEARARLLESDDSCYWKEQIAKSAYLVLTYQSMRVLVRCFGALDDDTCGRILGLRQFVSLRDGQQIGSIPDFRDGSLSDGPLTTIGRILLHACDLLWERHTSKLRVMPSRQQTLLTEEWVGRLSDQVDLILDRISHQSFRVALEGPDDANLKFNDVRELFV
jgi:hypothetical protein